MQVRINPELAEERRVFERLKHFAKKSVGPIDITGLAILELDMQHAVL